MISLRTSPDDRILELGCGDNPHPSCTVHADIRPGPGVDVVCDMNEPLPFADGEFSGLFSCFAFEHVSWRKLPQLLGEVYRILKPGGKVILIVPNTEAQMRYILDHPNGWEERDLFTSASVTLFGDQNYAGNFHACFFSPKTVMELFTRTGFVEIRTHPFGGIMTDMIVEAVRGGPPAEDVQTNGGDATADPPAGTDFVPNVLGTNVARRDRTGEAERVDAAKATVAPAPPPAPAYDPAGTFNRGYFNGGFYKPFYWDAPHHWNVFQRVLLRQPKSVLEVGCARGYVGKRLQDAGVPWRGIDVSRHCQLTRAADGFFLWDATKAPWLIGLAATDPTYDLCFSHDFLDRVPEERLPVVLGEMKRHCRRGLHGVNVNPDPKIDPTRRTLKPIEWWRTLFASHGLKDVEVLPKENLEDGPVARELLEDGGLVKVNLGCAWTMFHNGWINVDAIDVGAFPQQYGYRFQRADLAQGVPFGTGTVDLAYMSHVLEHFPARLGLAVLRDVRRALKADGLLRVLVPDAALLMAKYAAGSLADYDELSEGCAGNASGIAKLWALLHDGHQNMFDADALCRILRDAGFAPRVAAFRQTLCPGRGEQLLREVVELGYDLSLVVEGVPAG